ncbi:DUF4139 domain-containing protein, partial [Actinacidiphila alni]|uniref:DUF4139 domain-containing protein n=1 Tax=Actinacidiphila alni TaxID=380248 RepID=UPI00340566BE
MGTVARDDAGGADTPPAAPSKVTSVVVHAAGAVVTRRARITVPDGDTETTVRIGGLPPTLYEQSLRGRVVNGPEGLRVTDVRLDVGATVHRGEQLPGLRLDLEDAEDQQARLQDRKYRLESEIEEVAALRAEPPQPRRGDPPRWAPVESLLALASFVDARLGTLHERLRTTEDRLAVADHDVDVLRDRVQRLSSANSGERTDPVVAAVVTLAAPAVAESAEEAEAPTGAGIDLDIEYHVPGACWLPTYQLRLDGDSGRGTLILRASVAQRTGEDWTGVRLGLSTADLLRRSDLPELRSLRIGRAQEEARPLGWREPPPGLAELFTGYDSAAAERPAGEVLWPAAGAAAVGGFAADAAEESFGYGGSFAQDTFAGGPVPPPPPAPGAAPPMPLAAAAPAAPVHQRM